MQLKLSLAGRALCFVFTLFLVPTPTTAQPRQVEQDVREALREERDLRRLEVSVAGGDVTLTGELQAFWATSETIRRALEVQGVQTISSEIVIPPPESDEALGQEIAKAVQRYAHYTVFNHIGSSVTDGTVRLFGKVTPDRDKAGDLFVRVAKIRGVQDVRNQIETLTPSSGDVRLRNAIARQVFRSTHFQRFASQSNPPFHIIVDRSTVTLVGYVQGEIEYRELERITRHTLGVLGVDNQLQRLR